MLTSDAVECLPSFVSCRARECGKALFVSTPIRFVYKASFLCTIRSFSLSQAAPSRPFSGVNSFELVVEDARSSGEITLVTLAPVTSLWGRGVTFA